MFDDPKKELRRLQQQLLEDDEDSLDDVLADAHRLLEGELPDDDLDLPPVRGRNTDPADLDLEEYSDAVHDEPRKKGVKSLLILLCLELLGIAAVAVYWLLFLL